LAGQAQLRKTQVDEVHPQGFVAHGINESDAAAWWHDNEKERHGVWQAGAM
jgi:hypothetical protein